MRTPFISVGYVIREPRTQKNNGERVPLGYQEGVIKKKKNKNKKQPFALNPNPFETGTELYAGVANTLKCWLK